MTMWIFLQDLNQMKRDYPDHWETFIGNAQAMTSFGTMDNFTAEYISKMLGTTTVEQVNVSTSFGTSVRAHGTGHVVVRVAADLNPKIEQHLNASDEPPAHASRRNPRPEAASFASSWDALRRS
jgi:hypothetical protein